MNRIKHILVWLSRLGHIKGFGIQSPTDFSFVNDVVNETSPYYAYSEVGQDDPWLQRRLGRLYLRLANYWQPALIVDSRGYGDYLRAGCRKAGVSDNVQQAPLVDALLIVGPDEVTPELLHRCTDTTMLVVEDIATHKQQWKKVVQWPAATITYDLYYCGIATFNPQRAKQHYIVNF